MKLAKSITHSNKGFTLIEIIVSIIAIAILGYIFSHLMGTAMSNSYKSVELVAGEAEAEGKLNEVITSYIKEMNKDPDAALSVVMGTSYDFGGTVTMQYIKFDLGGNEITSGVPGTPSNTVKVTVDAPGKDFITIITKSRDSYDPVVRY